MKKFIALLTVFALLTGMFLVPGTTFAEEKSNVTLKQAIEIAKTKLGIKTEGFEFNSSYVENQNGFNLWNLNWNNYKTNNESISVSIDAANGEIISVGWWVPTEAQTSRIPKYTKADALKAAQSIAANLQGEKFKLTKLVENPDQIYYSKYSDTYNFEFRRVHDGIEVPANNITINLDKNTLKLRSFNVMWDKGTFPAKSNAMSMDKAKAIFKSKLGLELSYNLVYGDSNKAPNVVLAYTLKKNNAPIDAMTGELLNNYMYRTYAEAADKSAQAVPAPTVVITPEENSELEKNSKYISKEDAEKVIRQYLTIGDNMKLERSNLYPGYHTINAAWNLEWRYTNTEDNSYKYLTAQVDAVTKEFKYFSIYDSSMYTTKEKSTKITKDQAKKLAEDFLSKVQPEKFKNTTYREQQIYAYDIMPAYQNGYNFNYIRVENGIPCPANSLNVTVNDTTGEIIAYNTNWLDIKFPTPGKVITLDQAYDVLFSKVKFEMQYINHYKNTSDYENKEIKLAYVLGNDPILIDATSSQMLGYDGTPLKPTVKPNYTDIKGNKAEDEINLLIELGIIEPETTKFAPESKVLQKDFIKLLVASLQPAYYPPMPLAKAETQYDNYYTEAIRRKIITAAEKKPEAYVTRQDAAKMIIKAMGYGTIAEKGNMFAMNFKDANSITPAYKGYTVIAAELGIIVPDKNCFNPTATITKGDTAEILVNYMRVDTPQIY